MSDVKEMFDSPWRELQKNLASGFAADGFGQNPWICGSRGSGRSRGSGGSQGPDGSRGLGDWQSLGDSQAPGRVVHSWLVRARSRTVRVARVIQ
jgi:hypothetical protein